MYLHFFKGFKIELENLSDDIKLIIECCKTEKNYTLLENIILQIKDWNKFINLSYSHGVFPLVYHTLKEFQDQIPIQVLAKLKSINLDIAKQNMLMTSELIKVMKLLEENYINAIAFKGPILSQMAYGDITLRQYVDLDILIDEKDLENSISLLNKNNYITDLSMDMLKNKICFKTLKDITMIGKFNGVNIEIHWKLFEDKYNNEKNNILHKKTFINFKEILTLSNELNIVYLCLHGSKHMWERIEWIIDIDKICKSQTINWNKLIELINLSNMKKSIYLGFYLSYTYFNTEFPKEIISSFQEYNLKNLEIKVINNINYFTSNSNSLYSTRQLMNFQKDLYDSRLDSIYFIFNTLFKISTEDCLSFNLNKKLSFLLIILKPFRLIKKYFKN
ncbi:nucleotidyltransferase family protein [Arcobacter arenosus]|uniref:Nucleotidyltransferase family protein n=1 Tax=Arcobacter arenosus TaxID=2576037 RepID=A0A5R8XYT3_9BACT|nr:nucleotidyltransferase family protein [Arcobacter arenosus]